MGGGSASKHIDLLPTSKTLYEPSFDDALTLEQTDVCSK